MRVRVREREWKEESERKEILEYVRDRKDVMVRQ